MAITDLTGTTWVFGTSIPNQYSTAFSYAINYDYELLWSDFLAGSKTSLGLTAINYNYRFPEPSPNGTTSSGTTGAWELYYGYRTAPKIKSSFDGFQSFKITITGGDDVTNATLIAWLEANATQQVTSINVSMTSVNGVELATAGKYCDKNIVVTPDETSKANLVAENIKKDVSILGVVGTLESGGAIEDISTADEMTALLVEANVGKVYRFTGTTDETYTNGDLYEVVSE